MDVACYIGKQNYGSEVIDRWIGTGGNFETQQIAGWRSITDE